MNNGSKNFKRWKANAKGNDLNRQYKADWDKIKNSPKSPSYKNYKGKAPESAKEVKAIVKFVNQINPEMTVAYHSSGRILYWNYKQSKTNYNRDHVYAKKIGKMTGYSLVYPGKNPSGGGFSDWFISTKKRPSFTPEIGKPAGETNLPVSQFSQIWKENQGVGLYVAQESIKLKDARDKKSAATLKKDSAAKLKTAKKLEKYYYTDIKSTSNLKITDAHQKLFNTLTKDITTLQSKVNKLPSKHTKSIKADITAMKTYTSRSLAFMNAVKFGSTLQTADKAVVKMINDGIVSSKLPDSHKKLNQTITQMQKKVTLLYGKGARTLFTQQYITPAKRTAEDTKYDVERYNLLVLIEGQVKKDEFTAAQTNLNKLPALEKKSIDLKKKNLSKYPTYTKWEINFKPKVAKLQERVTDKLNKAEEAAKKVEDQKRMEQEKEKTAQELKEQQAKENEKTKQQVRDPLKAEEQKTAEHESNAQQQVDQLSNEKNRSSFDDKQKPVQQNPKPISLHNSEAPSQIVNN